MRSGKARRCAIAWSNSYDIIRELALFGSVLRDDFRPDSDIDVLVTFCPNADWSLFDRVKMQQELGNILDCFNSAIVSLIKE